MAKVEILLTGLTNNGKVYKAGDIEEKPSESLMLLAQGKKLLGNVVARLIEDKPKPEEKPIPIPPPVSGGNSRKKGR